MLRWCVTVCLGGWVDGLGLGQERKIREESFVLVGGGVQEDGWVWGSCLGCETLDMKLGGGVNETNVTHVDEEIKVAEEVSTKDGSLYISHNEDRAKGAVESMRERVP